MKIPFSDKYLFVLWNVRFHYRIIFLCSHSVLSLAVDFPKIIAWWEQGVSFWLGVGANEMLVDYFSLGFPSLILYEAEHFNFLLRR